jgi:hypothetical protein
MRQLIEAMILPFSIYRLLSRMIDNGWPRLTNINWEADDA